MPTPNDTLFKISFILLTLMIFGMIVIGGLTRLTGSGLSIVEWKPITGLFPPLTSWEWLAEFSKYQQSPEFQKINSSMTLKEFQSIFWLEYIHRLWGRILAFLLLIPTFLMIFKKQHRELWILLVLLWTLGLAQGSMGWAMVKSGLIQDPHVSPYRLAGHLFLGFATFGVALWGTLRLYFRYLCFSSIGFSQKAFRSLKRLTLIALILVPVTAIIGAFVAGLQAGLLYNTFPLMGRNLVPREFLTTVPWWKDLFENPVSVQFLHRIFALITVCYCLGIWFYQRTLLIPKSLSFVFTVVAIAALCQFLLGVLTVLYVVPLTLAIFHQAFAFVLFGTLIYTFFTISYAKAVDKL